MKREISLFERPTLVCYCVAGGSSTCQPCRDRRAARRVNGAPAAKPMPKAWEGAQIEYSKPEQAREAELDGPCLDKDCGGHYRVKHHGDAGCSCHLHPPCSYCVDTTLECDACHSEPAGDPLPVFGTFAPLPPAQSRQAIVDGIVDALKSGKVEFVAGDVYPCQPFAPSPADRAAAARLRLEAAAQDELERALAGGKEAMRAREFPSDEWAGVRTGDKNLRREAGEQ